MTKKTTSNKKADGTYSYPLRELLIIQISKIFDERGWTQKQAADFLGVTQPRISDLMRGRAENFTIDLLVDWLGALDQQVSIEARPQGGGGMKVFRQRAMVADDAIPYYTKAITLDPLGVNNYIKRGDAFFAQKKYDLAIGDYTRALELAPSDPWIRLRRADSYNESGQSRATLLDCDLVLKERAGVVEALSLDLPPRDSAQGVEEQMDNEIVWWAFLCKGRALEQLERVEEAFEAYAQSIKASPDFGQPYFDRAKLYESAGRNEEALHDYEKAVECDAGNVPACDKLQALRRKLQTVNAPELEKVNELTKAIDKAKTPLSKATLYRERADIYNSRGDFALAIADFERARDLDPSLKWLWSHITNARYRSGDYEGTIKDCDVILKCSKISFDLSGACMYRGWALERLDRKQEALDSYNQGLQIQPDAYSLIWARGILLEEMGKMKEALSDYRRTIELSAADDHAKPGYLDSVKKYADRVESKMDSREPGSDIGSK